MPRKCLYENSFLPAAQHSIAITQKCSSYAIFLEWFLLAKPIARGVDCMFAGGLSKLAAFLAERAMGGAGLIVTGGISPNSAGVVYPLAAKLTSQREAR